MQTSILTVLVSYIQAALATHALKKVHSKSFAIDPLHSAHAAATGSTLASFVWNLKSTSAAKELLEPVEISCLKTDSQVESLESDKKAGGRIGLDWESGVVYGRAQVKGLEIGLSAATWLTSFLLLRGRT